MHCLALLTRCVNSIIRSLAIGSKLMGDGKPIVGVVVTRACPRKERSVVFMLAFVYGFPFFLPGACMRLINLSYTYARAHTCIHSLQFAQSTNCTDE
jgi:hypothetical protein